LKLGLDDKFSALELAADAKTNCGLDALVAEGGAESTHRYLLPLPLLPHESKPPGERLVSTVNDTPFFFLGAAVNVACLSDPKDAACTHRWHQQPFFLSQKRLICISGPVVG
jgi:hypothetical protein